MSQYTGQKRKSALDSTDGFSSAAAPPSSSSHIPAFVSKVPWYLANGASESSTDMSHQKSGAKLTGPSDSLAFVTGKKGSTNEIKTKFIPGSCENCGSATHTRKACLERPRKILAKYSGVKLASDDLTPSEAGRGTFEAKRDRWRGFEAEDYDVDKHRPVALGNKTEPVVKLQLKPGDEEALSVANLRVREDTAKYLMNLDLESAHYDPKSRSMRDDPNTNPDFKGDNFVRFSGEADEVMQIRRSLVWEGGAATGSSVNEIANPTESLQKLRQQKEESARKVAERKADLEKMYGANKED